ncbi:MAG: sugar phosphate isomerase/epimerase [Chloroflexi bacterium]|nr:sugar phosphate isomerase/epimerase [Chloroflexota bacterium]
MKLSFVISTQPTQFQAVAFDPNFDANVARLAQLGYDGVELAVREPSKLDVVAIKRTLDKHKLQVPAIGTGQVFVEEHLSFTDPDVAIREQALTRVQSHIELAHEFNALVIIGLIRGKVQPNVAREQAYAWLVESMKKVARAASARDVRVVIEPINRYETDLVNNVPDALTLVEEIGARNVGVLFDTFHANIEEPRIETGLMVCRSHLFHVHIADSNRWYPGAGHTDFGRVIATLRAMKYGGWISAEILPKPEMLRAAEQTMRTMKDFLGK